MGFAHKIKLNLKLPYLQVDAAKPQGSYAGRTLRGGSQVLLSVCSPAKVPFTLGTPGTVDGPPCRADFDTCDNNVMAVNEFQLLNVT